MYKLVLYARWLNNETHLMNVLRYILKDILQVPVSQYQFRCSNRMGETDHMLSTAIFKNMFPE